MSKKTYDETIERLSELLNNEHGRCEQNTCAISKCMQHGYYLWAMHLFSGTGACSEEFGELYDSLPKRRFNAEAEAERAEFVKSVDSCNCPHCNAVLYEPEECGYFCDNCAKRATLKVKVNQLGPDGVSEVNNGWVSGFKVVDFEEGENECVFEVAMEYGRDPSELTLQILEESIGVECPVGTTMKIVA